MFLQVQLVFHTLCCFFLDLLDPILIGFQLTVSKSPKKRLLVISKVGCFLPLAGHEPLSLPVTLLSPTSRIRSTSNSTSPLRKTLRKAFCENSGFDVCFHLCQTYTHTNYCFSYDPYDSLGNKAISFRDK